MWPTTHLSTTFLNHFSLTFWVILLSHTRTHTHEPRQRHDPLGGGNKWYKPQSFSIPSVCSVFRVFWCWGTPQSCITSLLPHPHHSTHRQPIRKIPPRVVRQMSTLVANRSGPGLERAQEAETDRVTASESRGRTSRILRENPPTNSRCRTKPRRKRWAGVSVALSALVLLLTCKVGLKKTALYC